MQNLKLNAAHNTSETIALNYIFDACRKVGNGSRVEMRNGYSVVFGDDVRGVRDVTLYRAFATGNVALATASVDVWDCI